MTSNEKNQNESKGILRIAQLLLGIITIYATIQTKFDSTSDIVRAFIFLVFAILIVLILERIYANSESKTFLFFTYLFSLLLISVITVSFVALIFDPQPLVSFKENILYPVLGIDKPNEEQKTIFIKGKVVCRDKPRTDISLTHERIETTHITDTNGEFVLPVKGTGKQIVLLSYLADGLIAHNKNVVIDFEGNSQIILENIEYCIGIEERKTPTNMIVDVRDNKEYNFFTINGLDWFQDNLKFKSPNSTCHPIFANLCDSIGRYYTKAALHHNICPAGWRIPTQEDWQSLISFFGGGFYDFETSESHENSYTTIYNFANDKYISKNFFHGIYSDSLEQAKYWQDFGAYYWSSTENEGGYYAYSFRRNINIQQITGGYRTQYYFCRCVR